MSILLKCCIKSTLWLLTCHTQEWICIHKRAGRQTILVWQHTRCRGCCNPWSAMLRLQSSFFIHDTIDITVLPRQFLKTVIASIASMATLRNLSRFTLLESFLTPSLTNGPNFHCTRVKNNQICELLPSLNSCCEGA